MECYSLFFRKNILKVLKVNIFNIFELAARAQLFKASLA